MSNGYQLQELVFSCSEPEKNESTKHSFNFAHFSGRHAPSSTMCPSRQPAFIKSCESSHTLPGQHVPRYLHAFGRFYLVVCQEISTQPCDARFKYFSIGNGPEISCFEKTRAMDLMTILHYCKILEDEINYCPPNHGIAMRVESEASCLTNAIYFVGTYMILKLNSSVDEVEKVMRPLSPLLVSKIQTQTLLRNSWEGLSKATTLGWVDFVNRSPSHAHQTQPHFPVVHELVPGKLIAVLDSSTPEETCVNASKCDGCNTECKPSPQHYISIMRRFNVDAVVCLDTPTYEREMCNDAGIGFADLIHEDGCIPPVNVVAKFMMIAEGLAGPVAVHGSGCFGRTVTLIGLYMMTHYGFSAREAVGWIGVLRPGSITSMQQNYLCQREAVMRRAGDHFRSKGPACAVRGTGVVAIERLIAEAVHKVDRRLLALQPRRKLVMADHAVASGSSTSDFSHTTSRRLTMPLGRIPEGADEDNEGDDVRFCAELCKESQF